ncbi:immunity protein 21 of polymorphic toxin system [Archangium gephyra]|uniref:Immunity protein 21 of polymorphic toxin system n=1 Tax=Archangium gephyra TaxID=48 RepID=A0ABX9JML4_9BACT|nr:immunity protein 21 of polymorphic toxin system [Archangium gephyra]
MVLLPKDLQPRWQGTCGVPSDYEVACGVEGYVGVIEMAGGQVLVLGDEPLQTAVFSLSGRPCLVRWVYAPSPGVAESFITAMVPIHLRGPLESVAIHVDSSPLVLMDAGAHGEHPGDTLELELEPGSYRVHVYEFAPARDMKFLVHAFEQHSGK